MKLNHLERTILPYTAFSGARCVELDGAKPIGLLLTAERYHRVRRVERCTDHA